MLNPLAASKRSKDGGDVQEKPVEVSTPPSKSFQQKMSLCALGGKVALITGASKGMSLVLQ